MTDRNEVPGPKATGGLPIHQPDASNGSDPIPKKVVQHLEHAGAEKFGKRSLAKTSSSSSRQSRKLIGSLPQYPLQQMMIGGLTLGGSAQEALSGDDDMPELAPTPKIDLRCKVPRVGQRPGPCGSSKEFKKCCGRNS